MLGQEWAVHWDEDCRILSWEAWVVVAAAAAVVDVARRVLAMAFS